MNILATFYYFQAGPLKRTALQIAIWARPFDSWMLRIAVTILTFYTLQLFHHLSHVTRSCDESHSGMGGSLLSRKET